MEPVGHRSNNMLLRGSHLENCVDVAATATIEGTQPVISTFWKPSEEDIANILAGGLIMLSVVSTGHPPVRISVEQP